MMTARSNSALPEGPPMRRGRRRGTGDGSNFLHVRRQERRVSSLHLSASMDSGYPTVWVRTIS